MGCGLVVVRLWSAVVRCGAGVAWGLGPGTPLFAALVTLANSARTAKGKSTLGWLNPMLYQLLSSVFNDVTVGVSDYSHSARASASAGVARRCLRVSRSLTCHCAIWLWSKLTGEQLHGGRGDRCVVLSLWLQRDSGLGPTDWPGLLQLPEVSRCGSRVAVRVFCSLVLPSRDWFPRLHARV